MRNRFRQLHQSKTVRTIAVFATGNMLAMVLGVFGSLVQARYIGPEAMGVFRTFGIATGYLTFLHLGVFDGLQRAIPIQLGRGDRAKAEQAAAACLSWILLVSSVCSVVFFGLALRAAAHGQWMLFWGWMAYIPVIFGTFYSGYLGTTFRTGQQFIMLSRVAILQSFSGAVTLFLMPFLGYFGACIRTAVGALTNLFFLHRWRPLKVKPRWDWHGFYDVIRVGLPLSGAGYLYTSLWVSLEGTFVLHWFGLKVLGLYGMSIFVRTVVVELAQNMNHVMNVKIYEQYGRTGKVVDCVKLIWKPTVFAFVASLPLIVLGWFLLPYVVHILLPKYTEGIPLMRMMLLAMPITFLALPNTILWATGRRIDCFASVVAGLAGFVVLSFALKALGEGARSILIASLLGQVINLLASYLLIFRLTRRDVNPVTNGDQ
jgi:O-antigen/teichoic acid export membrane protein